MEVEARAGLVVGVVVGVLKAGEDDLPDAHVEVGEHVHGFGNAVAEFGVFRERVGEDGPEIGGDDAQGDNRKSVGEDYVRCVDCMPGFRDGFFSELTDLEFSCYHDDRGYEGNDPYAGESGEFNN